MAQPRGGGVTRLYVRRLDELIAAPLPGTENAAGPFFSPDGQWLGFFDGIKLKKIAVSGGAPVPLADATSARGGSWAARLERDADPGPANNRGQLRSPPRRERVVMAPRDEATTAAPTHVTLWFNFVDELRRLAPMK